MAQIVEQQTKYIWPKRWGAMVVAAVVLGLILVAGAAAVRSPGASNPVSGPAPDTLAGTNNATQISEGGQVTVKVTWPGPAGGLVFRVSIDTHSVDLDGYDLSQLAILRTDLGAEIRPSRWDAPPGGHHREGMLSFPDTAPDGAPILAPGVQEITLIIRDVGDVPERTFRWKVG